MSTNKYNRICAFTWMFIMLLFLNSTLCIITQVENQGQDTLQADDALWEEQEEQVDANKSETGQSDDDNKQYNRLQKQQQTNQYSGGGSAQNNKKQQQIDLPQFNDFWQTQTQPQKQYSKQQRYDELDDIETFDSFDDLEYFDQYLDQYLDDYFYARDFDEGYWQNRGNRDLVTQGDEDLSLGQQRQENQVQVQDYDVQGGEDQEMNVSKEKKSNEVGTENDEQVSEDTQANIANQNFNVDAEAEADGDGDGYSNGDKSKNIENGDDAQFIEEKNKQNDEEVQDTNEGDEDDENQSSDGESEQKDDKDNDESQQDDQQLTKQSQVKNDQSKQPLRKSSITQVMQQDYQNICYDRYIDKFKGNDYRWKDPQVVFYKMQVLRNNIRRIKSHNLKPNITYILGINQYADLTLQQFTRKMYSNTNDSIFAPVSLKSQADIKSQIFSDQNFAVDWSCYDTVPVSSGDCNSQYAFAVLSAIQITMRMHDIEVQGLSVQEIVSCAGNTGKNSGCEGGDVEDVFKYVQKNGVGPIGEYRYIQSTNSGQASSCNSSIIKKSSYMNQRAFIESYGRIPKGECTEIIYRLRFRSLVVKIDPNQLTFYRRGSLKSKKKLRSLKLQHEVTLVGYNPQNELFKIKNSWGKTWGQGGYAWVSKNVGICQDAFYPNLKTEKAYPNQCQ